MIRNSSLRRLSFFALLVLHIVLSSDAHAQISFVQISDPHLFDDASATADNRWNNKAAFISGIDKINQQVLQNNRKYSFVVITGDLGLESLVTGVTERKQIESNLKNGAAEFASMLVLSKVHHWLFVPGNNDLLNEELKNIEYYHFFIDALRKAAKEILPDFEIRDLCPKSDASLDGYQSRSDFLKIGNYAFIGFDDSSFKNSEKNAGNTSQRRIDLNAGIQEKYVKLVRAHLDHPEILHAYIFYHIPATDDPHLVIQKPEDTLNARYAAEEKIGGAYFHSAWFVDRKVRNAWNTIVIHDKVKGLFAGHFHDHQKQTYQSLAWQISDYPDAEVEKLHVCPPLSLRLQNDNEEQARGFQEVYVDEEGKVSARIVWLNQSPWSLSPAQNPAEDPAMVQFELGQTFEGLDRFKEAEAAYAKAAESDWPPTRKTALEALNRVVNRQEVPWYRYLWNSFIASLLALLNAFVALIPVLALALLYFPAKRVGRFWGRNKVKIGPITDAAKGNAGIRFDEMGALVLQRILTHFKPRRLIKADFKLPLLVKSQSPEIKEILDAAAPSGIAKLFSWVWNLVAKPRYSIQGIVDSNLFRRRLFISLEDRGDRVDKRDQEGFVQDLSAEQTLAFWVLKRLIKHMNL